MKGVVILGSTGSIGQQTLDVIQAFPQVLRVVGLAAGNNLELLVSQARRFQPQAVSCLGPFEECASLFPPGTTFTSLEELATHPEADIVMVATTGKAGLQPTLAALQVGKAVALANKEVIVMAGELVTAWARRFGTPLLPVDSEPSAIWQCLQGDKNPIRRILLTASGGPFRTWTPEAVAKATPEDALNHPTWRMGKKITVDSATLMNKAFEVTEIHWLFDVPWQKIEVVVHPQSIVHSMVEFADGSVKAQMSPPDMRLPIQYALLHPSRLPNESLPRLDLTTPSALTFEPMDATRFPCFNLAREVGERGGTYPAALCGADEVAVELFLQHGIGFADIHRVLEQVVERHESVAHPGLEEILAADAWARDQVRELAKGV